MGRVWIGVDAGKASHHAAAVDEDGELLWHRPVRNDEAGITDLVATAASVGPVTWAVDLISAETALLRGLLAAAGQTVIYVPGRTVKAMAAGFPGEAKTDARDALVIGHTARMRRDIAALPAPTELLATLALLLSHRADLIADWVRVINRLRRVLVAISPELERALNLTTIGALVVVSRFPTPEQIRRAGRATLVAALGRALVPAPGRIVDRVLAAADRQSVVLPGQGAAAVIAADLADHLLRVRRQIKDLDKAIAQAVAEHPQAEVLLSLPGIGTIAAAEFIVAVGDLSTFAGPDNLAAYAGLAPVAHDSGRRVGNLRRPTRYHRRLRYMFCMAALTAVRTDGPSKTYYQRKRREGRNHKQALIALARRRVNVLWALLRDNRTYSPTPPAIPMAVAA